ncbi:MAG: J domain-containing protein [Cyclobacteriaceae bacterium]|nr:J domain-containing protein [Cyclobacteriaceae bacterium]UYN85854.1 MAG: J domain-containing protein [Cyclobacteriaceae bacterium]
MADFYQLLGIDRSATSTELRAAYKKLAFQYHPDLNPGNPQAEEMFKAINEAYHTLSDPLKKSRYDARLNAYQSYSDHTESYWRDVQRQRYQRWKASQASRYTFDKEYFRIQGLAFLTFLIIAGICFGIVHTISYVHEKRLAELDERNKALVTEVFSLFHTGQVDQAFKMINSLREQQPVEFRFYAAHDSLLNTVRLKADHEFNEKHFPESLHFLEILKKQETPVRMETLRKLAICEYNLGDYAQAIQSLKHIYSQQPWNLEALYQIAIINLDNLNNNEEALTYFTLGKDIFKKNQTSIYGKAFEIVMDPRDAPDIYYHIFEGRARANLNLKNYREAETDCNWAIFLRSENANGYKLRVIAKVNQNITRGVCNDLAMAVKLGAADAGALKRKYCPK